MTAIYNPTLCAELAAEMRSAFGRYIDGDGRRVIELADQLEAAGAEVEAKQRGYDDLHHVLPGPGDIWTKVDALLTEVTRLRIANASLIPGGMISATEIECLRVERDGARAERDDVLDERGALRAEVERLLTEASTFDVENTKSFVGMLALRDRAVAESDALSAEVERLRFYETTSAVDALRMLNEARADNERMRAVMPRVDELDSVMSLLNWTRVNHDRESSARAWLERVLDAALAERKPDGGR